MVARLDLFRDYFQRLDPKAMRVRALRDELYIEPPGRALGEQLATRLQLAPTSSHLIVGGVGAGKTTQLLRAAELLKSTGDTRPVYVDVSRRHDLDKNLAGALLVLAGLELSKLLKTHDDAAVKATCEQFSQWAYGHDEFVTYDPSDDYDYESDYEGEPGHYVHRPGILAQPLPPLPTGIKERIAALKTLTAALPPEVRHFVILFDSLDRLDDVEEFQKAAVEDVRALQQAEIGLAIVGPSRILYGTNRSIVDIFDQLHTVPAVDVLRDASARDFLERVLARRADERVISSDARSALVHWSGGILRDLLELTRSAVEEAFVSGADSVTEAHIERSVDAFGRTMMFGLRKKEILTLQKLRRHKVFVPTSDDDLALVVSRRIIEYPGITKRYSVHPTIEPLLASLGVTA